MKQTGKQGPVSGNQSRLSKRCKPVRRAVICGVTGLLWFFSALALRANHGEAGFTPVREVLRDANGDRIPDRIGQTVTVTGILTSDPVVTSRNGGVLVNFQDATGGLCLFAPNGAVLAGHFSRGDIVQARGRVDQHEGAEQLLVEEIRQVGAGQAPAPREVRIADLHGERYSGQLVAFRSQLRFEAKPQLNTAQRTVILRDETGEIEMLIPRRFLSDAGFVARLLRGGRVSVVGIATQRKEKAPFDAGYRVVPRDMADITFETPPPYAGIAVGIVLLALAGVAVYSVRRRRAAERIAAQLTALARDLRESEEALRLSEERFSKAFRSSPDVITISTLKDGRLADVNDTFLLHTGYRSNEVIGRTSEELGLWKNRGEREAFARELTANGRVRDLEIEFHHRSGSAHTCRLSAEIIEVRGESFALCVVRDITRQKQAEHSLRASEQKFRTLAQLSPAAILVHDEDRFRFVNRAAEALTGYSEHELLGMELWQVVHPDSHETIRERRRRRARGEESEPRFEIKVLTKQGEQRWVDYSAGFVEFAGRPAVLGTAFDITERKRMEEQLRQAQKMEAVGRLAGGVAHDFNNLLAVITGYSELMIDGAGSDEVTRRRLEEIRKAAERAAVLTRQLLAFGRKQILCPRDLDLNEVVSAMEKLIRPVLGSQVEMKTFLDEALGRVRVDPGQIEQVVMNLALNARDAMPAGGRLTIHTCNLEVAESAKPLCNEVPAGSYAVLRVSDTGAGMSAEIRARIFEPFFTTKGTSEGTGLGLATVYGIVKQSGGHVRVESAPGSGTTFEVFMPRVKPAPGTSASHSSAASSPSVECAAQGSKGHPGGTHAIA